MSKFLCRNYVKEVILEMMKYIKLPGPYKTTEKLATFVLYMILYPFSSAISNCLPIFEHTIKGQLCKISCYDMSKKEEGSTVSEHPSNHFDSGAVHH